MAAFEILTRRDAALDMLLALVADLPAPALPAIARGMNRAGMLAVGDAVRLRFTGKGPFAVGQNKLGVRTGLLRRSLRSTKPQYNLRTAEVSMSFGSNVVYFAAHEFGIHRDVHVRGHIRRAEGQKKVNNRGKLTKASSDRFKSRLKSGRAGYANVKPHGRKMKMPARKPLGTQLEAASTRAHFGREVKIELTTLLRQ